MIGEFSEVPCRGWVVTHLLLLLLRLLPPILPLLRAQGSALREPESCVNTVIPA